jgi:hypothetical protein
MTCRLRVLPVGEQPPAAVAAQRRQESSGDNFSSPTSGTRRGGGIAPGGGGPLDDRFGPGNRAPGPAAHDAPGPDELLVVAKVEMDRELSAGETARA